MYCTYNVTLRHVRATIVVLEQQEVLCILRVFVALGIQHAMRMRLIVPCALPDSIQYFSTLFYKRHDFRKKKKGIQRTMCVVTFSTFLSEKFLIAIRIEREVIKNVRRSSCKVTVILVRF
jgi:hypothetical protein